MREYLNKLPKEIQDLLYLARDIASDNKMPAYLVGGFVRDLILGVNNMDLDIIVEGDAIRFAHIFSRTLKAKAVTHKKFGTATVTTTDNFKIDFARARKEYYPKPAHLPLVMPGTLRDDLSRRDFTINAMAISISGSDFGRLIDLFNGISDLTNKKIRVLHSLSFIDDPTRILRAIRFQKRYGFLIESNTLGLLKEAVNLKMLHKVHPHRLRDELILILKERQAIKIIRAIDRLIGFSFISERLSLKEGTYRLLKSAETEIERFKNMPDHHRHLDVWIIYLAVLIGSLPKDEIKSVSRRYALRKIDEKRILDYASINKKFIAKLSRRDIEASEIFSLLKPLSCEVIVLIKAKHKNALLDKHIRDFLMTYSNTHTYITGNDLRRLGLKPGPHYKKILNKILGAKLNGRVKTKEDELALAKKMMP